MANKSISMFPDGGTIQDTDLIPISRNRTNMKATIPFAAMSSLAQNAMALAQRVQTGLDRKANLDNNGLVPLQALALASEDSVGVAKFATVAELNAGLARNTMITPYALANSTLASDVLNIKRTLVEMQYGLATKVSLVDGKIERTQLPQATDALLGCIKPDNTTVTVDVNGVLRANANINYATVSEVNGGTITTKAVTPQSLAQSSYMYALRQLQNTVSYQAQQIATLQQEVQQLLAR